MAVARQVEGHNAMTVAKVTAELAAEGLGIGRVAVNEKDGRPAATAFINSKGGSVDLKLCLLHQVVSLKKCVSVSSVVVSSVSVVFCLVVL
jgi:hypothetical protein